MVKFQWNGETRYINHLLASQLDSFIYNIKKDWDFVIVISGDRMVRVGKSTLGQVVGAYLSYRLVDCLKWGSDHWNLDHIYFDSKKMTKEAMIRGKFCISIYDEGREGLSNARQYDDWQKDLLDYFAECGQLNHIFIIILDDFFGLPEQISVGRAECLLNVYRVEKPILTDIYKEGKKIPIVKYVRGQFQFFNRHEKQLLYDISKAKRRKSYTLIKTAVPPLDFTEQWFVDENEYKKKKREYLVQRQANHEGKKQSATDVFRDKVIQALIEQGCTSTEMQEHLKKRYDYDITSRHIRRIVARIKGDLTRGLDSDADSGHMYISTGKSNGEGEVAKSGGSQ